MMARPAPGLQLTTKADSQCGTAGTKFQDFTYSITCQTLLAKELHERPRVAVRHGPICHALHFHFHCIMTKLLTLGLAEASMAVFHLAVLT